MGTVCLGSTWKRGNAAVQPSGSEASRHKREDPERCAQRSATKRTCETCSLSGNSSPSRVFSDPRGERIDDACGTLDGLGVYEDWTDSAGRIGYFLRERDATSS